MVMSVSRNHKVIRGKDVIWAEHDPRPCQLPPDWSGGYSTIYTVQSGEDQADGGTMQPLNNPLKNL